MRLWTKILLFLSSYSFLFIILGIRFFESYKLISLLFFIVVGVSIFLLMKFLKVTEGTLQGESVTASKIIENKEIIGYVGTYLIPLSQSSGNTLYDLWIYLVLVVLAGIIYISQELYYLNPILTLLGYRIFEVEIDKSEDKDEDNCLLITKLSKSEIRREFRIKKLDKDIYLGGND